MAISHLSKDLKTWKRTTPIRRPDNIISSGARQRGEKGFVPSYESDPKEWMNFLMSNEYMRIWFKERAEYEREIYAKKEMQAQENKIKRRYVQRMVNKKKQKHEKPLPIIQLKQFKDIPSKTEHKRQANNGKEESPPNK